MLTKWLEKHSLNGHCLGSSNISGTSDSRCGCQLYCLCEGNLRAQHVAGHAHSKRAWRTKGKVSLAHTYTHTVTRCYPTAGTEETHPVTGCRILKQIQTIWTLPDFESYYYLPPCHVDAGVESRWEKTGLRVSGECPSDPAELSALALGLEFLPEARPSLRVWNPSLYRLTFEECGRVGGRTVRLHCACFRGSPGT